MPRRDRHLARAAAAGVACAVVLLGCGGSGGSTTGEAAHLGSSPATGASKPENLPRRCGLAPFLHSLEVLEAGLAAGLSYEQYFHAVAAARQDYGDVPVGALELPCLTGVGAPAERALDEYIAGANAWRQCRSEVSCGTPEIEPRLQRRWRAASHFLAEVQRRG